MHTGSSPKDQTQNLFSRKPRSLIKLREMEHVKIKPRPLSEICLFRLSKSFLNFDVEDLHNKLSMQQMERLYGYMASNEAHGVCAPLDVSEAASRIYYEPYWARKYHTKHAVFPQPLLTSSLPGFEGHHSSHGEQHGSLLKPKDPDPFKALEKPGSEIPFDPLGQFVQPHLLSWGGSGAHTKARDYFRHFAAQRREAYCAKLLLERGAAGSKKFVHNPSAAKDSIVGGHGFSWRQAFLQEEVCERLQRLTLDHSEEELDEIKKIVTEVLASQDSIFHLRLEELPSHVDLSFVLDNCPTLCSLSVTYGYRRLPGMAYERAMMGMKISDAQCLGRFIRISQTLTELRLQCNMIDDELVKVLIGGLQYAHMLTFLDLSHNKICDRGARRLGTLLESDYCLVKLNLHDNQIHANGCMHLGAKLADNLSLRELDLSLNRGEDNGMSHLFQDLCVNKSIRKLSVSCNDLSLRCLPYLSSALNENTVLEHLDLSGNPLFLQPETDEDQKAAPLPPQDSKLPAMDTSGEPLGGWGRLGQREEQRGRPECQEAAL